MERLYIEGIPFVIRLNLGDQHKRPRLIDADGSPIKLFVRPGKTVIHRQVFYLGIVPVNLIGYRRKGLNNPLWVISSLEPQAALQIFQNRMKIEMTICFHKSELAFESPRRLKWQYRKKLLLLATLAYPFLLS